MPRRFLCKVLLVAVAVFGLLALSGVLLAQGRSEEALQHAKEVQKKHTDRLLAIDGVEGTAIGLDQTDRPVVKVFTARPAVAGIPEELDKVAVQVVVTGKFYALGPPPGKGPPEGKGPGDKGRKKIDPTKRCKRPVPIGVSTGNEGECSAGTIGCRVTDGTYVYALSNNHVYALENTAPEGSNVLQPGTYDAKPQCAVRSRDVIGTLHDFEPIVFYDPDDPPDPVPTNEIDAAIALTNTNMVGNATPSNGYGTPKSTTVAAYIGQPVQKYGRTTQLTQGEVWAINATVDVGGYSSGWARFVNQIMITPGTFSDLGDSGSLVVHDGGENDRKAVGLLFAGSSTMTVANPIDPVLGAFGVTIDGE